MTETASLLSEADRVIVVATTRTMRFAATDPVATRLARIIGEHRQCP